jgi:hypothetical protein
MRQALRLGHYDGAAATFFDLFPLLSPHFAAFQLMETDVVPLVDNWAKRLEERAMMTGRGGSGGREEGRGEVGRGSEDSDGSGGNGRRGMGGGVGVGGVCASWWQQGSPPLCNPDSMGMGSAPALANDLHLNGNSLYALNCEGFDEYLRLVQVRLSGRLSVKS